jgi:zinc protease
MKKYFSVSILQFLICMLWMSNITHAQISKVQFDNGFTLIYFEKKDIGLVSSVLFIKDGSAIESDKEAGITNLMTQLLTRGTINRSSEKIAIESESLGTSISASCSNDYIEISMIVLAQNFDSAFDIFADVIKNPIFPKKEFEKEKILTIAAIKSKSDHIFDVAFDYFNEFIFKNHPYHRPVIGYEKTVSALTISQISDNYRKNFKPENMILCIAGDIDFNKTKSLTEKYFANIKIIDKNVTNIKKQQKKENNLESLKKTYTGKFKQSYIFTGFLAPDVNQKDYAVIKIINTIVGGGMGSRLFDSLREKSGLVYEANSFYPTRKETSNFVFYAGTSKKNLQTVEKTLYKETEKLSEVSREELRNAKEYLKGTYLLDHRSIQRQAWYLGWWEIMGKGYEYDQKYLEDIDKVSIADIQNVCKKYFNPKKVATVILK